MSDFLINILTPVKNINMALKLTIYCGAVCWTMLSPPVVRKYPQLKKLISNTDSFNIWNLHTVCATYVYYFTQC